MDSSASVVVLSVSLHVITVVFLFLLSSVYADNSLQFCFDQSTSCVLSVRYPLERYSYRDHSCGYPGFEVHCTYNKYEGRPFMNISNHIYHVREVDYESKEITLVDSDVEGSGCPQPKRNFSFPSSPSWVNYYLPDHRNITIFYDCSSVPADAEKHLLCSQQDTNTPPSYAFYNDESSAGFDWYGNCAQNVVVPVMFSSQHSLNYSYAIIFGFIMGWSATDWCRDCEHSGGQCWSIHNSTTTGCACKDYQSYNRTCPPPYQGVPPTPSTTSNSQHRKDGLSTGLKIGIDNADLVLLY